MTNSMALKAIVGLLIMGAAVVALAALPQDRDQQKCINAMTIILMQKLALECLSLRRI